MKIIAITDSYPPHHSGGYELRSQNILEGLRKRGHDVNIITTRCPEKNCKMHGGEQWLSRVLHKKSEIPQISKRIYFDVLDMRFIDRMVDIHKPDVVYLSHLGDLSSAIVFYFSNRKIPIIFDDGGAASTNLARIVKKGLYFVNSDRDPSVKRWIKKVVNYIIHMASGKLISKDTAWPQNIRIIFNNEFTKKTAREIGVPIDNSKVIWSGVDTDVFGYQPRECCDQPVRIIVPGRIEPQKGTKDAVHLISLLTEQNIRASLTIVGNNGNPSYYNEIIREIRDLYLENHVQVLPMISHDELARQYRESDFCFFPSYHKTGTSRVPLEAMACGCIVLSYGNEGSSEIINNAETGFVCSEGDIQSISLTIMKILSNESLYKNIAQNARREVEEKYSLTRYLDQVETFILSAAPSVIGDFKRRG